MAIRTQIVADALRLIAAVGSFATSTTLLSGLSNAATLHDAARKLALESPPELEAIADALLVEAETLLEQFRELPPDAEILLIQMARETRVTPETLLDADLDPARIADALTAPLSTYPAEMRQLFNSIAQATMTRLLTPKATAELQTRIMAELLKRQAEALRAVDDLTAEFGTLAEALRVLTNRAQSGATHRRQLEALAWRLDIPSPHKLDDDKLHDVLAKKADELNENRPKIAALIERDDRVAKLKAEAERALDNLDFDAAQMAYGQILSEQLSDAAQTFEVMAGTALLANRTEEAFRFLTIAADSFGAHDPQEALTRRQRYARILADHGRRYGSNALEYTFETLQTAVHTDAATEYPHLYALLLNDFGLAATDLAQRHQDTYGQELAKKGVEAFLAAIAIGKTEPGVPADVVAHAQHNLSTLALLIAERLPNGDDWDQTMNNAAEVIDEALSFYSNAGDLIALADSRMNEALISLCVAERFPDNESAEGCLRGAMPGFANALKTYEDGQDRQRIGTALLHMANAASLLARFEVDEEAHKLHRLASRAIDRARREFGALDNPVMLRRAILVQAGILSRYGRFKGGRNGRDSIARAVTLLGHLAESVKLNHDPALWTVVLETRARMRVDLSEIDPGDAVAHLTTAQEDLVSIRRTVADDSTDADRIDGLLETVNELLLSQTDDRDI